MSQDNWKTPQPIRPDGLMLWQLQSWRNMQIVIGTTLASLAVVGLATISPKWYRPWVLLGAGAVAHVGGQAAKNQRDLNYRIQQHHDIETEALADNTMMELTTPWLLALREGVDGKKSSNIKYEPDATDFISWDELRVVAGVTNDYKPRMILAPTGSGKTTLAEYLATMFADDPEVYQVMVTPTWQEGTFNGIKVVGAGANYGKIDGVAVPAINDVLDLEVDPKDYTIAEALLSIDQEFYDRQVLFTHNIVKPTLHIFLDEWRAINGKLGGFVEQRLGDWIAQMRKTYMVPYLITQIDNAVSIGLQGEAGLKQNFTYIYLGELAKQHAAQLERDGAKRPGFAAFVAKLKRPIMVDDRLAPTPPSSKSKVKPTKVDISHRPEPTERATTDDTKRPTDRRTSKRARNDRTV